MLASIETPETPALPVPAPAGPTLPESYESSELHLFARDPHWLHASWDASRSQMRKISRQAGEGGMILRVYEDNPGGDPVHQAALAGDSRRWFIPEMRAATRYVVELGYHDLRGEWVSVATSNAVSTPPDTTAKQALVVFATIPLHASYTQVRQVLGRATEKRFPLIEAVRRNQEAERGLPPWEVYLSTPEESWTPQQAHRLADISGVTVMAVQSKEELSSASLALVPAVSLESPESLDELALLGFEEESSAESSWSGGMISTEA